MAQPFMSHQLLIPLVNTFYTHEFIFNDELIKNYSMIVNTDTEYLLLNYFHIH